MEPRVANLMHGITKHGPPVGLMLALVVGLFVLTGCEPRVDEEPAWERSIAVEEFETFVREQENRSVEEVQEEHVSEGLRLFSVALEDVARRTLLAREEDERQGAVPDRGLTTPPDARREETMNGDRPVPVDPNLQPEDRPQVDQPLDQEGQAGAFQDEPRNLQEEDRAGAFRQDPGYHVWISEMVDNVEAWEAGVPDHPRPNDLVVTAYNNGVLVMRFLKERYYVNDMQLRSDIDQLVAAANAINAELPITEQEAATHTYFRRALDAIDRMDRMTGLDPEETPLPGVEVEGEPEPPLQPGETDTGY